MRSGSAMQDGETAPLFQQAAVQSEANTLSEQTGAQPNYKSIEPEDVEGAREVGSPFETKKPTYNTFSQIWATCLALWIGIFCAAMSATIVANVQVEIGSYFDAGSLVSWLGTAFLLGVIAINPLCGRLVELIGSANCFSGATALFLVGTILCAISPSMYTVLLARAVSGIGSGGISTFAAIVLAKLVSPADRGVYQGGASVLQAAGSAAGGLVGGVFNDRFGWRSVFWMQVPPLAVTMLISATQIQVKEERRSADSSWDIMKSMDWLGWGSLFVAVLDMTIGLTLKNQGFAWSHPLVAGLLLASVAILAIFFWAESRATNPLLPLSLLNRSQVLLLLLANAPLTAMWFARVYFQPIYLQIVRGMDSLQTGSITLPFTVVAAMISLYAGWHIKFSKEYKWLQAVAPAFSWVQALSLMHTWGTDTNATRLWVELAAAGAGAIPYTSLTTALIVAVQPDEIALGVSAIYVFRAIGQIWGIAIGSAIQQGVLASSLHRRLPEASAIIISRIINSPATSLPALDLITRTQARLAYFDSIQAVFGYIAALGIVLSAMCLGVRALPI